MRCMSERVSFDDKTKFCRDYITSTVIIDLVGEARPCECNGRSNSCDTETGFCQVSNNFLNNGLNCVEWRQIKLLSLLELLGKYRWSTLWTMRGKKVLAFTRFASSFDFLLHWINLIFRLAITGTHSKSVCRVHVRQSGTLTPSRVTYHQIPSSLSAFVVLGIRGLHATDVPTGITEDLGKLGATAVLANIAMSMAVWVTSVMKSLDRYVHRLGIF